MQDYWNDPPDGDEPPECCGDYMLDMEGAFVCHVCGRRIEEFPDWEPMVEPEPVMELDWVDEFCPHNNPWHDCDACDYLSDQAYDAWREG
jgi:hypothetical protein